MGQILGMGVARQDYDTATVKNGRGRRGSQSCPLLSRLALPVLPVVCLLLHHGGRDRGGRTRDSHPGARVDNRNGVPGSEGRWLM